MDTYDGLGSVCIEGYYPTVFTPHSRHALVIHGGGLTTTAGAHAYYILAI